MTPELPCERRENELARCLRTLEVLRYRVVLVEFKDSSPRALAVQRFIERRLLSLRIDLLREQENGPRLGAGRGPFPTVGGGWAVRGDPLDARRLYGVLSPGLERIERTLEPPPGGDGGRRRRLRRRIEEESDRIRLALARVEAGERGEEINPAW